MERGSNAVMLKVPGKVQLQSGLIVGLVVRAPTIDYVADPKTSQT